MKGSLKVKFSYNWILFFIAAALFIAFTIINPAFCTASYVMETIKMIIEIGIMALPLTLLIVMGGIDFSMASTLVLSAAAGGIVSTQLGNPVLGLIVTLGVGTLCGAFNGLLIARLKLPPLVTTLATMYLFKGIAEGITLGTPSVGTNVAATPIATFLGSGTILGIPTQLWIFVALAIILNILLAKTPYGRILYSIGLNENAAKFSGINTVKIKHLTYCMAGLIFAVAGLVFMGRFSTIQFDSADPYTMQIITAAVLGGCDMAGGRGDIKGTILGVAIIGILKGGMNVVLLPQTQQKIIIGVILLVSLIMFEVLNNRSRKVKIERRGKKVEATL